MEPGVVIEEQARRWLIRMDGDEPLSELERTALRAWMSRSAHHRAELRRLARFWEQTNLLTGLLGDIEPASRPDVA